MKPGPDIQAKLMARDPANGFYARRPEGCPCNPGFQYPSAEEKGQTLDERLDQLYARSAEEWEAEAAQDVVRNQWLESMTHAEASAIAKRYYARNPNPEIRSFDDCDDDDDRRAFAGWRYGQTEAEVRAFLFLKAVKNRARRAKEEQKAAAEGRELRGYVSVQTEEGHRAKTAKRAVKFRAKQKDKPKSPETPEEQAARKEKARVKKAAQRAAAKAETSVI